MGHVLDRGGILLARLPKGQLGEETAKLMGSFVFACVWQAATARARMPEPERRDASIYVDEAHNVLNLAGSVGDMLAEARGYHLSLVLAHQNLTQLPRETQLALSANARNKIFFSCSPEDAHQLARHTMPELDEHDLSHLDAYTAAARLVVASRETAAFTLRTRPPAPILGEALAIRQRVERTEPAAPTGVEQLARRSRGDTVADTRPKQPTPCRPRAGPDADFRQPADIGSGPPCRLRAHMPSEFVPHRRHSNTRPHRHPLTAPRPRLAATRRTTTSISSTPVTSPSPTATPLSTRSANHSSRPPGGRSSSRPSRSMSKPQPDRQQRWPGSTPP